MNAVIYRSVLKELGGSRVIRIDRGVYRNFEIGGPGIFVVHFVLFFFLGALVNVHNLQGTIMDNEFTTTKEAVKITSMTTGKPGSSSIAFGIPWVADQNNQIMQFIKPARRMKEPPISQ